MVLEFAPHQYVHVESIEALRWISHQGQELGIVALKGDKIVVTEREEYDTIETAFIWLHKSHMVDDEMKKVRYVKRGNNE